MLRTKFKYENKQRAITQKLSKQKLWFMCTAPHPSLHPPPHPTKFHNHSLYSLGDMHRTKFKYEKNQKPKGSNSKIKPLHLPLRCIHPQNFITIASIVLEI